MAKRPVMSVPMKLPWTRGPQSVPLLLSTTQFRLPEMMLRAPASAPPTWAPASVVRKPASPFPKRTVPLPSSPMRLPWTTVPSTLGLTRSQRTEMPFCVLPEMMLPAPWPGLGVRPPIRLSLFRIRTPSLLSMRVVPVTSRPMTLPCTTQLYRPSMVGWLMPLMNTPVRLPEMTLPAPNSSPPTRVPGALPTLTPSAAFPRRSRPVMSVPIKLPWITTP